MAVINDSVCMLSVLWKGIFRVDFLGGGRKPPTESGKLCGVCVLVQPPRRTYSPMPNLDAAEEDNGERSVPEQGAGG